MSKRTSTPAPRATAPGTPVYQLHVELEWVRPKVWRRLLVPMDTELSLLHVVLLWGMGWQGGHMHEFTFGQDCYWAFEPGLEVPDDAMDEHGVTLREALGARKTFRYVYDFGDGWRHKVKLEKVVLAPAPIYPALCIDRANACPPEDVGGAPGYEHFLEAIADPHHPEHDQLTEWIGEEFDPTAFDVNAVNRRLT